MQLDLGYVAGLLLCFLIYRFERTRLSARRAFTLVFLVFLLTSVTNNIHRFYVDHGSLSARQSNLAWQLETQEQVIRLSPSVAPHSYRFLPNSLVRWLELAGLNYEAARDIYRLFFGLLLFYAIYRYARLFTSFAGALLAMLLVAVLYPISFEYYAGQLTDPLSHLSFVLAFIFLETGDFALLLTTLVIGSLAKETVLALTGYYLLFCRREPRFVSKAVALAAACGTAYFGVRAFVLDGIGPYRYEQVSGVAPGHLWANLTGGRWFPLFILTAGALMPFLVLNWKETPLRLKQLVLFLLPVLFASSALFGWLYEARNFMPLVIVLAVIAGSYLSATFAEAD